jgi:DNA-directed RNA polymerase specialized sigma24 family protein
MKRAGEALAELKPVDRALLDLSLRRALTDEEIAEVLHVPAEEVAERREELLAELERKLGLETREAKDELRATLPDLPPELWDGRG